MRNNPVFHRGISIVVVTLLIALTFSQCIHANVNTKSELFDVTMEFCGFDDIEPSTIELTKEEYSELKMVIDTFKSQCDLVETREEANELFDDAIVQLDTFGLLGDIGIEETKNMITSSYQNVKPLQYFERLLPTMHGDSNDMQNLFCLIAGKTTNTFFQPPLGSVLVGSMFSLNEVWAFIFLLSYICLRLRLTLISFFFYIIVQILSSVLKFIIKPIEFLMFKKPMLLGTNIWFTKSKGWVQTIGLFGIRKIDGRFFGKIDSNGLIKQMYRTWVYRYSESSEPTIGIKDFKGLRLNLGGDSMSDGYYESFYIGSALRVKVVTSES